MAQHLFTGEVNSDKANLDVNFGDCYDLRNLFKTPGYTPASPKFYIDANYSFGVGAAPNPAWVSAAFGVRSLKLWSTGTASYLLHNAINNGTNWLYDTTNGASMQKQDLDGSIAWYVAPSGSAGTTVPWLQAVSIDPSNGDLYVSSNGGVNSGLRLRASGNIVIGNNAGVSGSQFLTFNRSGSTIGSVSQSGTTSVAYNTTSDYRLKTAATPITDSGAFIDALKPVSFQWAGDGTADQGFLAHEFQAVCPRAVNGAKDAVDEHGAPVYQGMDASTPAVIANIVAELQSLRQRLAAAGL
jgi:hypothetical protein